MKNFNSLVLIAGMTLMAACGSQTSSVTTLGGSASGSGSGTQTGSSSYVSGDNTSNVYNLPAASEQRIEMSGTNGTDSNKNLSFNTSRTLKVKISPLSAPNITIPGYNNWVFPYGCLQVTVAVNGITKMTKVLRVNGMTASSQCADAPTSETLDFTSQMSGSGPVTVTMQNAVYDNCRYSWPMYYGCYMTQVWQSHRVAMNVQVQTDGTWMAQ
jgi:hypothetical protein